ncbi:MAG: hypothetical protein K6C05_04530 [Anaerovibrio sp.]|uniref:hypothetical protein n=1 Tax=Anaerovibrio sp. TaxID=1872532 RepID=UPI0025D69C06|nr:hypothetical protein [Anaerovibrio sp.]MCR5176095.1 hypothetical protein [Anaerovibrio sp.]
MISSKMKKTAAVLSASMLMLGTCGTAMAAEDDSVTLTRAEFQALMDRIARLETRLDQTEKKQETADTKVEKLEKTTADNEAKVKKDKDMAWKFSGDIRARAVLDHNSNGASYTYRVRLKGEKPITENLKFVFRDVMMNENPTGVTGSSYTIGKNGVVTQSSSKESFNKFDNAYFLISGIGGRKDTTLKIGRFGHSFGTTGYWSGEWTYGMYDGVEFATCLGKLKMSLGFGDWGAANDPTGDKFVVNNATGAVTGASGTDSLGTTASKIERNYFAKLNYAPTKNDNFNVWHLRETGGDSSPRDYNLLGFGFTHNFDKTWSLSVDYSRNSGLDDTQRHDGKVAVLSWKKASYSQPHSFGMKAYYINVDKFNVAKAGSSVLIPHNDNTGYGLSLHYTIARNLMFDLFGEFRMKKKSTGADNGNYYRAQLSAQF